MFYAFPNPASKKELKQWVKDGTHFSISPTGPFESVPLDGMVVVTGPHYPKPHKWYAQVTVKNGEPVSVK